MPTNRWSRLTKGERLSSFLACNADVDDANAFGRPPFFPFGKIRI